MDTSMEEGDSMASPIAHHAARRAMFAQTADFQDPDASYEYTQSDMTAGAGASPAQEGDTLLEEDQDLSEEYAASDTSSAMFDQDADPEGWARRLDELAGVLEMGEEQARAIRWGPPIEKNRDGPGPLPGPQLPLEEFKNVINHHLTTTEWKYEQPPWQESTTSDPFASSVAGVPLTENHPIRVQAPRYDPPEDARSPANGLGIHGLPVTTR